MQLSVAHLDDDIVRDMEALLDDYYECTVAKDGLPPYDFDWNVYRTMDAIGSMLLATARDDDGTLLGFALYLVIDHPHHRGMRIAECDSLSVSAQARGKGVGRTLYFFCEDQLRQRGVSRVLHRYRVVYNTEPLFPKLGFKLDEQMYSKEL